MKRILSVTFAISLVGSFVFVANGQDRLRTFRELRNNFQNPPIEIIGIETGGKPFSGRQQIAGPDWLEDVSLIVKNISPKNIRTISITILIPKQGAMEHIHGLRYGFPQSEVTRDEKGTLVFGKPTIMILRPNETFKLRTHALHTPLILEKLMGLGVRDISEVQIAILEVTFDDDTGWLTGVPTVKQPDGNYLIVKP